MEKRQLFIAFAAAATVFVVWTLVAPRLLPKPPVRPRPTTGTAPAATPPVTAPSAATTTAPAVGGAAAEPPTTSSGPVPGELVAKAAGGGPTIVSLGDIDEKGPFPMRVTLATRGAAITDVRLRGFMRDIGKPDPYPLLMPVTDPMTGQAYYSFATEKIRIEPLRKDVVLNELAWAVDDSQCRDGKAVFRVVIEQDGRPVMEVAKTYELVRTGPMPRPGKETVESRRCDVLLTYSFRNLTPQPLDVILVQRGPMGLHQEDPRTDDRGVMAGIQDGGSISVDKKYARKSVTPHRDKNDGTFVRPAVELGKDQDGRLLAWAANVNKFFACIVRPNRDGPGAVGIAQAQAVSLTQSESSSFSGDMTFDLVTRPIPVHPHATAEAGFTCYLGPKSKIAFARVPEYVKYDYFAVMKVDFCCLAPAPIVGFMMALLQTLYWPLKNYGVAIILLVLIVRIILHPITKAGQVNMVKMQKNMAKLQPKIEELKKKYANDKGKLHEETYALMREGGASPMAQMLTCLPMFLQMPIWTALYSALAAAVEMRHAPFDGYWIKDLAGPDALIPFGREITIPLISYMTGPIHGFNLLPILLSVTMYFQQKFMPKAASSATQTPEQMAQQQMMMNFMTVFMGFVLYNAPSGLNLYIMASNIGGIFEQWRIRKHIRDLDARGPQPPKPGLWSRLRKPRFWEELERKAEEAKRVRAGRD